MHRLTSEDDPELGSGRCSCNIRRVLDVAEEGPVVTELGRTELDGYISLVDVSNKLNSVFELVLTGETFPIGEVEDLQREETAVNTVCHRLHHTLLYVVLSLRFIFLVTALFTNIVFCEHQISLHFNCLICLSCTDYAIMFCEQPFNFGFQRCYRN